MGHVGLLKVCPKPARLPCMNASAFAERHLHDWRWCLFQVYSASLSQATQVQSGAAHQSDAAAALDSREAEKDRADVVQSLQALMNVLQAVPKLTALMASRPALAPLLNCIEPICRSAPQAYLHPMLYCIKPIPVCCCAAVIPMLVLHCVIEHILGTVSSNISLLSACNPILCCSSPCCIQVCHQAFVMCCAIHMTHSASAHRPQP